MAKAQRDLLADAPNLESAAVTDSSQPKLGPHDFEILRVVGQGAFGKVGGWGGGGGSYCCWCWYGLRIGVLTSCARTTARCIIEGGGL